MERFHLTTPQQNIWNLQTYYEDTAIANLCGAVFFREKRDSSLMQQAVCRFIQSQSGLRLRFCAGEEPVQYVSDESPDTIPVMDFKSREVFDRYAEAFSREPLGLTERQMYRFVVFHLEEENRSGILVVLSHLISDAWTFGLMANQLDVAYRGLCKEGDCLLAEGDYIEFIQSGDAYMASERYEKDRNYWEYAVCPERSPIKTGSDLPDSIEAARVVRVLPLSLEQKLSAYCKTHSVTEAVLFETALIIYLARISPENRSITIGVPVLNRSNAREKKIAGMFVSTMPLTVELDEKMEISELELRISRKHRDLFRHQKYPYAEILRFLREKKDFEGSLYDVMISYQNARTDTGADTRWYSNGCSEVPLIIHIDNRDGRDCHTVNVDYQTAVFRDAVEVEYLIDRLEYILEQIADCSAECIGDIRIVPKKEWEKVVYEFNDTYVDYPRGKCIHELFTEQARRTPERTALVFEDRRFTYRQLDEMSNSLAHFLREKGVGPGDVVPIIARRSWHVIVAMLGVLKAGGAYMPVDPEYPVDRIDYMIKTTGSNLTLVYNYGGILETEIIKLDELWFYEKSGLVTNANSPEDLAYVIYTSGSTGLPKGVKISHCNVCNYVNSNENNICHKIIHDQHQSIVSVTNIVFDIFVTESLLSLVNGICIYFANDMEAMRQKKLSQLLKKNHIDVLQTTPTKLKSYILDRENAKYLQRVKVIILGGEKFPQELYFILKKYTDARIYNVYGPAETTVWSTYTEVTESDITIGKPIANTQIYILNDEGSPLPIGVPGELCIAGEGVGKGYLNRPELTAERFVQNPFATEENRHGKIMYRTGDLARWRSDGEIEYLGRIDTQVKIRGLRIEPGEIESVMGSMEGIGLAAVKDQQDEDGRQYLVGYYTADQTIDEKRLRGLLASKLPRYMVPNYFMRLDAMPMTPSGKTDRKNLPALDVTECITEYVSPTTDTEKMLAVIWQELLKVKQVGRTDSFFELGGDSLLAIAALNEIESRFQVTVTMKDIMENDTLERLGKCVESVRTARIQIADGHRGKYELLPQQKAIYIECSKESDTLRYNMPAKIMLPQGVDRRKLKSCLQELVAIHEVLRTCFVMEDDRVYGICDESADIEFEEYDDGTETLFLRPFDLGRAPLLHIGFTEDAMLFDIHHIIADGESVSILLKEIEEIYGGKVVEREKISYADYAAYFADADRSEHRNYFKQMLSCDFEPLVLPEVKASGKAGGASKTYEIPMSFLEKGRTFAERHGLTDTMLFLGIYGILLSRYTGKTDILSSVIMANRIHTETRKTVGMFVNTLPVLLKPKGDILSYFREIKELVLNLFAYQELPFIEIAEETGMKEKSVVNTSFVYQGNGGERLVLSGREFVPKPIDTHTAKFDLTMEVTPAERGCRIRLEYNLAKYDERLMDDLADGCIRILEQLDQEKIAEISVLSQEEYHKVTEVFNDTYVDYPREKCVHELFTEQAKRMPDKVALVFEDCRFTYRQLDEMSNSLAHFLREKGVEPEDVVPIIAKRSWHMIVAMLGVLKAGGAYMTVDPEYPIDRISHMLDFAGCKLALLYNYNEKLDIEISRLESFSFYGNIKPVEYVNSSKDLAYVVFTSGSTGIPKGIAISHSNIGNYVHNNNNNICCKIIRDQYKSIVSVTNFIFDIFVTESLLSLVNGLCIYLANNTEIMTQRKLSQLLIKNHIDILQTTPTKMKSYILDRENTEYLQRVKVIILGGEKFPQELYCILKKYTDARIYNVYGPAETTVWSTYTEVTESDITIGSPIANTQIYILNEEGSPLPIGVPGELCIAREGVGKGYLNRPELTAERFVQNPFATEENCHGKIMYRTGDLARWRSDGEIEYLGRIDTQVKIRGLRIELGEIESVMGSMEGIGLTAVKYQRDEAGRQYLVGYYTADHEVDGKKLRELLASKLPRYMVPNYFLRLDAMPMTPSGKTDRKNLPVPDFSVQTSDYVAPVSEQERKLCSLLKELFHVEQVGVTDDFFELGGDSLTAIEYVAKAHDRGIAFSLQNVFDYPTVRQLCARLTTGEEKSVNYQLSDFDRYRDIFAGNVVDEAFIPKKCALGTVLLTGATGFLGAHVLDRLMREESGTIYCLVREGAERDCGKRLRERLQYYFGDRYEAEFTAETGADRRILPVAGDISREDLAECLPKDVQTVIHTAATVKHYGSYDYFRRINTEGTRHITAYAKSVGAKLIHISTVSVSGNSMADDFTVYRSEEEKHFYETSFYIGQPLDNVYVRSKFEAERMVYDAMLEGLEARVIRVGNLTNRTSDYRFQPNYRQNAFLTRVKAALEFGMLPDYLMSLYSEFSPVDLTAEGIVRIAQYADWQTVFHLNSNRPVYFDRLLQILRDFGISMNVVSEKTFREALQRTIRESGREYIYEAFQNDMDEQGRLVYDSNIRIENEFTVWFLKKTGFEWNEIDREYLRGYLEYFRGIGYLEV